MGMPYTRNIMKIDDTKFIKGVERLINPIDIGTLHFFQTFNRHIPAPILIKLLKASSKKSPYMGFVVEPYSLFLFHKIIDVSQAQSLLTDRFELIKTCAFDGDSQEYYVIIGNFNTHTSGFWGTRQESYIIARDKVTDLLTWIIINVNTNTISVEPNKGIVDPNCRDAVFTTNSKGKIILDIKNDLESQHLDLECQTSNGQIRNLDQRLWLEGNLSVDYGIAFSNGLDEPFSLTFDPAEVETALNIPLEDVVIKHHTLFTGLIDKQPSKVVCFPYAQHFISDSPGNHTPIKNEEELVAAYLRLGDLTQLKGFSAASIRKQFFVGMALSALISTSLLIFLILHFYFYH